MRQEKKYVVKRVAWPVHGQKLQHSYKQEVHEAEKHFQPKPNRRMIAIHQEKMQGKTSERRWNTGTESLLNFCSNQFRLPSERFFCLVIDKEMSNKIVMSTKYHLCWWTEAAAETLKEQGGEKREF